MRRVTRDHRPDSRDGGRVSVFLAITFMAVIIVIGITVDAAGKYRALQRADNLAAEAARTGGQQIDVAGVVSGEGRFLDKAAATAAVDGYLDSLPGVTDHTTTFTENDQRITVTIDMAYQTTMLNLFGYPSTITVTGQATAVLRSDP
ncbi:pilus assembly protein TadG-related protein [Solwaraspora sp. WMMB335]|uniref:pilus assembly protein TadG-related protein n=1 Tax=Solwaraspora sp. WMMB335 TaxID=3404118 RepID=UPI003B9558C3